MCVCVSVCVACMQVCESVCGGGCGWACVGVCMSMEKFCKCVRGTEYKSDVRGWRNVISGGILTSSRSFLGT